MLNKKIAADQTFDYIVHFMNTINIQHYNYFFNDIETIQIN